jgi:HlyD family secretion protein
MTALTSIAGGSLASTPEHRTPWKAILWVAVVLVLLVAGTLVYARVRQTRAPAKSRFEAAAVSRGPIEAKVTSTGTVNAVITVNVGSYVSGTITNLYVDYNSKVRKNDVLARIDPQLFVAALDQAKANVTAAEGNLAKARATLENDLRIAARDHDLLRQNLLDQQTVDTADTAAEVDRANIEALKGTVEQTKAALVQAKINLGYTVITSPLDGTVISRNVDVGQTVASSLQTPTLFLIAQDLTRMEVDTNIAEADVGRLQEKMTATFTVDAYPAETFTGTIRQVRNAPQTIQNVVTYDAVIDVDNREGKLRPGMTANVTVVYAERTDVVRVPNAALRFRPPEDFGKPPALPDRLHHVVWVLRDEKPTPVVVRTNVSDGSVSELTEGNLQVGDALITEAAPLTRSTPSFGRVL